MIRTVIHQVGDQFIVVIPDKDMQRFHLQAGDTIAFVPLRQKPKDSLRRDVQGELDDVIRNDRDALEHLAGCDHDRSERPT